MCEPFDEWPQKFDSSAEERRNWNDLDDSRISLPCSRGKNDFTFHSESVPEDDDEVTESKIRAFLDEKVTAEHLE